MTRMLRKLPPGWALAKLDEICHVNPRHDPALQDELKVSFVPMAAVDEQTGEITAMEVRSLGEVRKGYTHFADGDVIWAKITPCMENGKAALAEGMENGFACGSTEFFVLRSQGAIVPRLLYHYFRQESLRRRARARMTSAAGHARVPKDFLLQEQLPIPPLGEQRRIVATINELQMHSRRAREALETIPDLLDQLRQSVLAAAFRGDLTKQWRRKHPDVEPASELLKRIRTERRKRWEAAELEKLTAKGLTGEKLDSEFAQRRKQYKEPISVDTTDLPELPAGWCWTSWNEVGFCQNGRAFPSKYYLTEGVKLLRPGNLHVSGKIEWTSENTRWMPENWAERYKDYMIGPQELVMNLTAQSLADEFLGRVCITESEEGCLLNQRIARLTPVIVSRPFCLWLFKSPIFRRYVDTLNTGSLIQHMFTAQIEKFVFPLPPLKEQQALAKNVTELLERKEILADSVAVSMNRLESLDQCILGKAFRGGLVPQDPSDEPAAILLERIRELNAKEADEQRVKGKEASARIKQRGERDQAAP